MQPGKIPPDILQNLVFSKLGRLDPDVILGPKLGEDAAVMKIGDNVIVAATDPITGSVEDVGWLSVHVNANDIATFGVPPRWFLASIMLPVGSHPETLEQIMKQIDEAATSLNIAVTGGHSEITESISQPIVVGFMMGITPMGEYVTSSGAKPGDSIIVTKSIGIEGTSILATEGSTFLSQTIGSDFLKTAKNLRNSISVVKDGTIAYQTGFVHAMHDPTEGGLAGGIHEICDASDVGCEIDFNLIPIDLSTSKICDALEIDPLALISSGSMLIICETLHASHLIKALDSEGISGTVIGKIVSDSSHRRIRIVNSIEDLSRPITDALWDGLKKVNPA